MSMVARRQRETAVVVDVRTGGRGVRLTVRRHDGEVLDLETASRVDTTSARRDMMAVRRPLAVLIAGPHLQECVLLGTSRRGPTRHPVSLGSALALCESGVHTVLTLERAN